MERAIQQVRHGSTTKQLARTSADHLYAFACSSLMQQLSRVEQQQVSRQGSSDQPSSSVDPGEVREKLGPPLHERSSKLVQKASPEGGLNISAKDAGYKTHTESMQSGADIVLDALLEEKVNLDVEQALERIQKQQPLDAHRMEELGLKPSSRKK